MPTRSAVLDRNQLALERLETQIARRSATAYNQARRELVNTLLERWTGSDALLPRDAVDLLRRSALLSRIDERLIELERETGLILRDALTSSSELAVEQVQRELALLPRELRPNLLQFTGINERMVEQFLPAVLEDAEGIRRLVRLQLGRELQSGLLQGESFPNLVKRLMAATPTGEGPAVWRNGELSAELMTRRVVITAENAAKNDALRTINNRGGVRVKKQLIASIGPRTTRTCLAAHGQIREVDEPYVLTEEPRFARKMQFPAFHHNCRSSSVMYHESFEGGGLNTSNMRSSAQAELRRRRQ